MSGSSFTTFFKTKSRYHDEEGDIELPELIVEKKKPYYGEKIVCNFEIISKPLIISLAVLGLTSPTAQPKSFSLWNIYQSIILLLLWLNMVRFCLAYESTDEFGPHLFTKIVVHMFFLQASMSATACFRMSRRRGYLFGNPRHTEQRFRKETVHILRRKMWAVVFLFWLFVGTMTIAVAVQAIMDKEHSIRFYLLPFVSNRHKNDKVENVENLSIGLIILAIIINVYVTAGWTAAVCGMMSFSMFLAVKFDELKKDLECDVRGQDDFMVNLETYRKHHLQICDTVQQMDQDTVFSQYVLSAYMTHATMICFQIYVLIYWPWANYSTFLMITTLGLIAALCHIHLVTWSGILINKAACSVKEILLYLNLSDHPSSIKNLLLRSMQYNAFMTKLTNGHIGITAWGMFDVNKQTLRMVALMIITYTVMLFKFSMARQGSKAAADTSLAGNSTM